jgi:hypothetical protein
MPRAPILGRFCQNPNCREPIDPQRPKGTDYCDSSCRSEASRLRKAAEETRGRSKPRKRAQRKPQGHARVRVPTPYVVMKKDLDAGPIGGFVVVGFTADTNKRRAIAKIAAAHERVTAEDELVAVAVPALKLHRADGSPVSTLTR